MANNSSLEEKQPPSLAAKRPPNPTVEETREKIQAIIKKCEDPNSEERKMMMENMGIRDCF